VVSAPVNAKPPEGAAAAAFVVDAADVPAAAVDELVPAAAVPSAAVLAGVVLAPLVEAGVLVSRVPGVDVAVEVGLGYV